MEKKTGQRGRRKLEMKKVYYQPKGKWPQGGKKTLHPTPFNKSKKKTLGFLGRGRPLRVEGGKGGLKNRKWRLLGNMKARVEKKSEDEKK